MEFSKVKILAQKLIAASGARKKWESLDDGQKYMACFMGLVLFLSFLRFLTGWGETRAVPDSYTVMTEDERHFSSDEDIESALNHADEELDNDEADDSQENTKAEDIPEASSQTAYPRRAHKAYYSRPIVKWSEPEFSDLNDVQLAAARSVGVKKPMRSRAAAQEVIDNGQLVYAGASPFYRVNFLKHSVPYLVPKAYDLLNRIAINYMDSLQSRGIPLHQIVVTSLLRTDEDVAKLKRGNGNASERSCHRYATTFDISYLRYGELGVDNQGAKHSYEREIMMKRILGEVLRDLRYEGRCYVKHENRQKCFHVTVR